MAIFITLYAWPSIQRAIPKGPYVRFLKKGSSLGVSFRCSLLMSFFIDFLFVSSRSSTSVHQSLICDVCIHRFFPFSLFLPMHHFHLVVTICPSSFARLFLLFLSKLFHLFCIILFLHFFRPLAVAVRSFFAICHPTVSGHDSSPYVRRPLFAALSFLLAFRRHVSVWCRLRRHPNHLICRLFVFALCFGHIFGAHYSFVVIYRWLTMCYRMAPFFFRRHGFAAHDSAPCVHRSHLSTLGFWFALRYHMLFAFCLLPYFPRSPSVAISPLFPRSNISSVLVLLPYQWRLYSFLAISMGLAVFYYMCPSLYFPPNLCCTRLLVISSSLSFWYLNVIAYIPYLFHFLLQETTFLSGISSTYMSMAIYFSPFLLCHLLCAISLSYSWLRHLFVIVAWLFSFAHCLLIATCFKPSDHHPTFWRQFVSFQSQRSMCSQLFFILHYRCQFRIHESSSCSF